MVGGARRNTKETGYPQSEDRIADSQNNTAHTKRREKWKGGGGANGRLSGNKAVVAVGMPGEGGTMLVLMAIVIRSILTASLAHAYTAQIRTDEAVPRVREYFQPAKLAEQLLTAGNHSDVDLIFTADTQYYYSCTPSNTACLNVCAGLPVDIDCEQEQSRWSNRIQRQSIGSLIAQSTMRPAGLVINGDLTNYGHLPQLNAFKNQWLDLPIPVFPGLGNHDYENNINDCVLNHCANRMLFWLVKFAETNNFQLDYTRHLESLTAVYNGSFSYSLNICKNRKAPAIQNCLHMIQLHNRPNYEVSLDAAFTQWNVTRSWAWLAKDLAGTTLPTIINLHNYDETVVAHLDRLLTNAIRNGTRILAVLYGHHHSRWGLDRERCLGDQVVPFLFVGSVPNNRYMLTRFDPVHQQLRFYNLHALGNHTTTIEEQARRTNVCIR